VLNFADALTTDAKAIRQTSRVVGRRGSGSRPGIARLWEILSAGGKPRPNGATRAAVPAATRPRSCPPQAPGCCALVQPLAGFLAEILRPCRPAKQTGPRRDNSVQKWQ